MGNTIPPLLFESAEHQNGMIIWRQKKLIGPIGLKYLLLGKDRQVPPSFLTPSLFFLYICNWKDLRWICSRGAVGGDKKAKFGLKSLIWLGVLEVANQRALTLGEVRWSSPP